MAATATAPRTRAPRQATPERWQAALARAIEKGITARQIAGTGQWVCNSGSRVGIAYATDGIECQCEAAMLGGDPVCVHRAAYWAARWTLDLDPDPEPEPPTSAPAAAVVLMPC